MKQKTNSAVLAQEAGLSEPAYWEYQGTSLGTQIEDRRLDNLWLKPDAQHEYDYIKGAPLYREPPPKHPIIKVLNDPQAMELVALKATVAQQAQLIEWLQKGAPRQEPIAYMRNEGTPNNLVKCTFTCPGAFGVYRSPVAPPAPAAVVLPDYLPLPKHSDYPGLPATYASDHDKAVAHNACIDKVKQLNQ